MIRFTAILLTVVTGFSGLVYEVAWQKYLATLLGSHSEATAAVLAIYLGGLAAGYALFAAITRRLVARARQESRPARLLFVYGTAEIGIGIYALLFPALFGLAQRLSLLVPANHPGLGFAFDVGLSVLLIGPPTVLMGGTIPMLTLALAGDLERATRIHAWVYGFNTLGAFAGALTAAFLLIPMLGLDGTLLATACANLLAGAIFALLDRRAGRVAPDFAKPVAEVAFPRFASYALVAALAGFAMMTLQTTLNRVAALAFGSSPFTFAMIVAVFVLCIALGSLAVSALPRIPRRLLPSTQWALSLLLVALYLKMADAPYWAHVLRTSFQLHDGAFYPFHFSVFAALLALLAVPIGLSGALLPLIFDRLHRETGELGSLAGRLYAWNTVGSLLGALLGGYILFFWLDLHHIYRVAVAALALGAAILSTSTSRRSSVPWACLVVLPAWLALLALPAWSPERLTAGLFRQREVRPFTFLGADEAFGRVRRSDIVFYNDDPTSTVSVTYAPARDRRGASHSIVVNGKSDGSLIGDFVTMALSGLLPALMAESHERCFVIGFGTGVTAGELAALQETREVDVAEISRGVIKAAPIFDYGNLGASKNPKVKIYHGDAYRTLLKTVGNYNVIVSEPSNPWVTGVEMLFSQEFLRAALSRLAPGGVYAQWFHLYEVDDESVQIVLRTFASVFPHVSVWFTQGSDLLLLGFNSPRRALAIGALQQRFARPDFAAGFGRARIDHLSELLAHEVLPLGTVHAKQNPGEIHTLRHPILSYRAARAFFRGRSARLPRLTDAASAVVGAKNSLLRRYARGQRALPEPMLEAALYETCAHRRLAECTALLASWFHDYPNSERRRDTVARLRRMPRSIVSRIPRRVVRQLASLFGSMRASGDSDGEVPLQAAIRATNQYATYYYHAVPFSPRVIRRRWERCLGSACAEERRRASELLGFDLPARPGEDAPEAAAP